MKKYISLFLVVAIMALICAGCGSDDKSTDSTPSSKAAGKVAESVSDSSVPLEKASISSGDAAEKIKSLSLEKLGLEGKKEDYKFMVSTKGKLLDGSNCFEVVASKQIKTNKDGTVNMKTMGQYFLTYDGKKIYKRDLNSGEYIEITP